MDFTFSEEQYAFEDALRDVLSDILTPEAIRSRWESSTGMCQSTNEALAELGLGGMLVPESLGGLGLLPTDFVLLAQACGYAALPEPLVEQILVAAPMLVDVLDLGLGHSRVNEVLAGFISGDLHVAVVPAINAHCNFAEQADWFLISHGDELHLIDKNAVTLTARQSVDPSRRVAAVSFEPTRASRLLSADGGAQLWRSALNRGALGVAAQLLGVTAKMIDMSVQYTTDRSQFGRPLGANQAVKHLLADCAVALEYARPVVYRGAFTLDQAAQRADWAVSHAKAAASSAAQLAARHSTQVHGAMGYTWECDLHIWSKRAWALAREWGDDGFHKNRIHEWLLNPRALIGPEYTFGRAMPRAQNSAEMV
jgi:alkylation response protein AidB-like acyl-CoA dehydrogenase